ncbi:hypothetical protein DL763_011249 [Monosporascus cannonballus]|nr:hypothetical protein DL763_011249 [Monosporascus cannonballus]
MATPGTTKALSLSFGVEVELLMPWLFVDQKDPHEHVEGIPPAFRVERARVERNVYGTDSPVCAAAEIIFNDLRDTLEGLGLASSLAETHLQDDGYSAVVLQGYEDWEIEDDGSLYQRKSLGYEENFPFYGPIQQWVSLEIQSPVEYATPEAFEAIKYALRVLTQRYRMRVNDTCSVHVHVGQGIERLPLDMIRRIAGLSWAADLLLFTLHNPLRRANIYCQPIREYSNMAKGVEVEPAHAGGAGSDPIAWDCLRYLGTNVRHGEEPITWREENRKEETIEAFEKSRQPFHFGPFIQGGDSNSSSQSGTVSPSGCSPRCNKPNNISSPPGGPANQRGSPSDLDKALSRRAGLVTSPSQGDSSYRHESPWTRACPKMALPRYTATELQELVGRLRRRTGVDIYSVIPARAEGDIGVFEGVRQIFDAPSSCCVSRLLSGSEARGSISFNNYCCRAINTTAQQKRTIEFRMGEGCLDDWVGTWAAVCVGLVHFAMYAPVEEYLSVLTRCDLAAKQDGSYDVLDLLDDLCLFEEAEIAEKRILRHSKNWDVKFVG